MRHTKTRLGHISSFIRRAPFISRAPFICRSLAIIVTASLMTACGGSSSDSMTATSTPPTDNSSTPPPTNSTGSSETDGIFIGRASNDQSSESTITGIIAPDSTSALWFEEWNTSLNTQLSLGADNAIEATGTLFYSNGSKVTVSITGTYNEEAFQLQISDSDALSWSVELERSAVLSQMRPTLDGYYESDSNDGEAINKGLVLSENSIQWNDSNFCQYTGSVQPLSDNVFSVDVVASSLKPYLCSKQGEFSGLAAIVSEGSDSEASDLLISFQNAQHSIVTKISKASDEPEFIGLEPGIYRQFSDDETKDLSFGVSHDGQVLGFIFNNHYVGYFAADPNYLGKSYLIHDENVRLYNRSEWTIEGGNVTLYDASWSRIFGQDSAESYSDADMVTSTIASSEDSDRSYSFDLSLARKIEQGAPVQFSSLVGTYSREGANTELTIHQDGRLSGIHHGCDITGTMSERSDTAAQELSITLTRSNCPEANSFSLDGEYQGFGFVPVFQDGQTFEVMMFLRGVTDAGLVNNVSVLRSLEKQ